MGGRGWVGMGERAFTTVACTVCPGSALAPLAYDHSRTQTHTCTRVYRTQLSPSSGAPVVDDTVVGKAGAGVCRGISWTWGDQDGGETGSVECATEKGGQ